MRHSSLRSTSRSVLVTVVTTLLIVLVACGGGSNGVGGNINPPAPPAPLQVTTQSLPQGVINAPYSTTTLSATGGVTPYAWNVASGNLPPGLSVSRAGVVSGTPTAAGGYGFTVAVADSEQPPSVANQSFGISVNAALQVMTTSLPNGYPSISYSATLAATGGLTPYSWTITQGALPVGLTLSATSGVISGTPTGAGTSSFTVQVSDSETPATTATAGLSIVINPPPPRSAALYTATPGGLFPGFWNGAGLQIGSDGSLTLLPSSPESAITGSSLAASPTLPLLFMLGSGALDSLLVNPDYSLASYSSAPLPGGSNGSYQPPSVDPTGSNLYLPGTINSSGATGITIFPGDGSLQPLGTVVTPNPPTERMVFTPDATLAFIPTCSQSDQGSILSFSRSSNGMLTPAATYSGAGCGPVAMAVSSDGKYLATNEVQIYNIAGDGSLTAVLPQPFTIPFRDGLNYSVADLIWEPSGSSFLLAGASVTEGIQNYGGVAVLSFSGSALTTTVPPTGGVPVGRMQLTGSFVYAIGGCMFTISSVCGFPFDILGFDFQNGQLTPLPGAPYPYGNGNDMVIY
jgi:Putative Ig domain